MGSMSRDNGTQMWLIQNKKPGEEGQPVPLQGLLWLVLISQSLPQGTSSPSRTGLPFLTQCFPLFLSPSLYSSASAGNRHFCFENSCLQQLVVQLALWEPGFLRAFASVLPGFTRQLFSPRFFLKAGVTFGPCAWSLEGTHIWSWPPRFLAVVPLFSFGHTFGIFSLFSFHPSCLCLRGPAWSQLYSILLGLLSEEKVVASCQIDVCVKKIANQPCVMIGFAMFKNQGAKGPKISFF